ncbi:MAG: hypothetical protein D3906_00830 [Candidatus Electrothrix sp. AUS1_2]|nr:hypothetical protein [Candidatus Electrothrix sp. AUS1_2]
MSSNDTDSIQGRRFTLSLRSLYLDPNNYRFIDSESYVFVSNEELTNSDIQRRTTSLILGKNGESVRDLIDSFRKNGFLPVDQIQVKKLEEGKYLVVEGNRRVACLKWLQGRWKDEGYNIGKLTPQIFSSLPVVDYQDADDAHHLIVMALKHISGNKKWPPINQAELIRNLRNIHNLNRDEICESIAIGTREYNRMINALELIDEYKKSEYGDQFSSERFTLFHEIVRSRPLREWIQWDYNSFQLAGDRTNLDRLFSWISEDEEFLDEEDDSETLKKIVEPVITRSSQIKELAKLISDETALSNLDTTRNLSEATLASEVLSKDKVKNAVSIIGQEVNTLFNMSRHISDANRSDIEDLSQKILAILETGRTQEISASGRRSYLFIQPQSQFSEIEIKTFRRLKNIHLPNLTRINLFAGINNSGKTTVLEAVKLLASLNNPREFIDLVKRRAKISTNHVEMEWFVEQIPTADLRGTFQEKLISLTLEKENSTVEDETYYLQSACFNILAEDKKISSTTHFFEKYPQRTEGKTSALCPSVFSSPFSGLDPELLRNCHSQSLKEGSKQAIIKFITDHIDSGIQGIELDENDQFTVVHKYISPNPDLTKFGEGIQRIFKLGLLFAGAKNGVVMIDEFENAIHASILPKLIKLVYDLACQFNVQIFLSSHSKECIDAFTQCPDIPLADFSAYGLVEQNGSIQCAHFSGQRLSELITTIDFDLRGGKNR